MTDTKTPETDQHEVTVFHNPACSHSRGTLDLLNARSVDYGIVEYLITPPSRETLEMIIGKLIDPVSDLIRTTDKKFVEQGFDPTAYQTKEAVIDFLLVHPELMQRPIVIKGDQAIIGRPPEKITPVID